MGSKDLAPRFALPVALILFTLAAGTVGLRLPEGYSVFDAFYITLFTITTVGYQEVPPLGHAGRISIHSLSCLASVPCLWRWARSLRQLLNWVLKTGSETAEKGGQLGN